MKKDLNNLFLDKGFIPHTAISFYRESTLKFPLDNSISSDAHTICPPATLVFSYLLELLGLCFNVNFTTMGIIWQFHILVSLHCSLSWSFPHCLLLVPVFLWLVFFIPQTDFHFSFLNTCITSLVIPFLKISSSSLKIPFLV